MGKGSRVEFVGWYESDVLMRGTIERVKEAQTGISYLVLCDFGGSFEVPERFILREI